MGPVVSFLLHFMVLTLLGLSHRQTQDNPDLLDNIDWSQAPWHPPSSPEVSSSLRWCLQWPLHDVSTDSCRPDRSLAGSWTLRWTSGQRKLLSFPVSGTFVLELLFLLYSLGTRTLTALPVSLLSYHQGAVRSVILPPAACALLPVNCWWPVCPSTSLILHHSSSRKELLGGLADWLFGICLI